MEESKLREMVEIVLTKGPHRVMVDAYEATPVARAKERGIAWDVIFIRNDGWSLGATRALEVAAHATWSTDWQARVDVATKALTLY